MQCTRFIEEPYSESTVDTAVVDGLKNNTIRFQVDNMRTITVSSKFGYLQLNMINNPLEMHINSLVIHQSAIWLFTQSSFSTHITVTLDELGVGNLSV